MTQSIAFPPPAAEGRARTTAAILTIGYATTVAMWAVGYVSMMNPGLILGEILFGVMLACLLVGGLAAGRFAGLTWKGGAAVGAVAATLNLMLVGSLISAGGMNGVWWVVGNYAASIALGAIGAALGRRSGAGHHNWIGVFAKAAVIAVFLLLITGGLVTALEAGLAVPDWPTSFGHNMLLYPLAEMTGGIYYEHAHRLYGMLVGLTSIILMIVLFRFDPRRSVRILGVAVFLMVCLQGLMGGIRVTEISIWLAIVHGIFAQVIFATLVCIAAFVSTTWQTTQNLAEGTPLDRKVTIGLPNLMLIQLVLGALYRHLNADPEIAAGMKHGVLGLHILIAVLVTVVVIVAAGRAWGIHKELPVLPRTGLSLLVLIALQLILGMIAVVLVMMRGDDPDIPVLEVIVTTAHQVAGALLLAGSMLLLVWNRRLLS